MIPSIREVYIENYKSIEKARVTLEPFTVLVGANGSGKSNFVDALAFVQESLAASIELALQNRGGLGAVRRVSGGRPFNMTIGIRIDLDSDTSADYSFQIASRAGAEFQVVSERCSVEHFMKERNTFEVKEGRFTEGIPGIRPKVAPDRLALYAASAVDEFRQLYDFLIAMRFYSIAPHRIRELQEPDRGDFLKRDGSNAAAVLRRLRETNGLGSDNTYDRVCSLLSKVVMGIDRVEYRATGSKETIRFRQNVGLKEPWTFEALNMSDGTLRVLGVLLALYQRGFHSVVAIEEPESTVHPAAAEIILGAMMDMVHDRQILVTTHSPDILDSKDLDDRQIRVVATQDGRTVISELAAANRSVIRERLYTPGELLRMDELRAEEPGAATDLKQSKLSL